MKSDSRNVTHDICETEISQELSTSEKLDDFIRQRQTGSSNNYKVGTIEVECVYGDLSLREMLNDLILG